MKKEKGRAVYISRILFVIYLVVLVWLIVFKYPIPVLKSIMDEWELGNAKMGVATANLTPFKTIHMYVHHYHTLNGFDNLFGNVLVFVPLGVLIPSAFRKADRWWEILLHSFWLSLCLELFQLVSHFGAFDVDDIILNTLGGILGFGVFLIIRRLYRMCTGKEKSGSNG